MLFFKLSWASNNLIVSSVLYQYTRYWYLFGGTLEGLKKHDFELILILN